MKKVLFIEDDTVVRENTAELLELADYNVITAANGKSGVAIAKQEKPDIIICDIMMPEMDGYGVLQALSQDPSTRQIPFIFLSAKTEHKDIRKGMDLGADDYLTKPFEEEELISAIESRLAKVSILKKIQETGDRQPETPQEKLATLNDLREMVKEYDQQNYKSGETIYEEGKMSNHFFFVDKGVVKSHRMDQYGKELITSIYKEGDFFGNTSFHKSTPYNEYATAMEDTRLFAITKDELKNILMNNSNITLELIDVMGDNIAGIKEQLLEMAYGSVRKKAARTILLFSQKIRRHPTQSIRISRSDLASVAGMASETLIRTLSDFKKEGLLEIEGRNIKILDVEALKRIS
ncbi:response regulator [Salinimicrobium flavum]|uniref:Response regulator n=1 Tax=Salinimicrobium flavum TaxID=1737065 RepID=A0ABW5IWB7_9FLAO